MAYVLDRNFDFLTNGTVTAAGLHNLIDETDIYAGLISTQEEKTTVGTSDLLLVADSSSIGSPQIAANRTTVYNLFEDALTGGTYANAQLSGNLTYGTATGNRTISTGANITNGTISTLIAGTTTSTAATITSGTITTALIPTLTAGTTTGTAGIFTSGTIATLNSTTGTIATLNSTTGTIATLNSTTGTIATLNSTTGTIATLNSTTGTIATLNSTTGTITNLSTTLAGDFTISQGTGAVGSGKITFPMLSTSTTESDNVAKRTTKAWVNFTGTGTVTIRNDFNVTTVGDNGVGDYLINFTVAMEDVFYCAVGSAGGADPQYGDRNLSTYKVSAAQSRVISGQTALTNKYDASEVDVCVFR
jgi:hypothetical protein